MYILNERNMFVAENFIRSLVEKYGRHVVYTDGGTWYPQACRFLHLKHMLHSPIEKSLVERAMQYFKDRIESFGDHYPCIKNNNCDLEHVNNWLNLYFYFYLYFYNTTIRNKIPFVKRGEAV
jgi:putative transposase